MTSELDTHKKQQYEKWEIKMREREKEGICSEKVVINQIEKRANFDGWDTLAKNDNPGQTGIDLKLKKKNGNCIIIIEAKGERVRQINAKGRTQMALGAIIMDMKEGNHDRVYCLAFPNTANFQKAVAMIPTGVRKRLGLNTIFVDCTTGVLRVLLPDRNDVIDLSSFEELKFVVAKTSSDT